MKEDTEIFHSKNYRMTLVCTIPKKYRIEGIVNGKIFIDLNDKYAASPSEGLRKPFVLCFV
jgi:hypothetical protein